MWEFKNFEGWKYTLKDLVLEGLTQRSLQELSTTPELSNSRNLNKTEWNGSTLDIKNLHS